MNLLIKNVNVLTLDESGTIIPDTHLAIAGNTIAAIGAIPPDFEPEELIDGYNHLAVPGFFNAHSHIPMTFERGWAEDLPLDRWFNERIWVAESALTPDDVYWGAALGVCELIRAGCVAFNDHYFYMDRVAEIVAQSGIKAALTWCQFGLEPEKEIGTDLAGTLDFIARWHGQADGRIRAMLGPHSPYICGPEFLRQVSAIAAVRQLPIHLHLAESQAQVANSLKAYGRTPVEYLDDCGIFQTPCVAAHALYLSPSDIALLAQRGVSVAHCPLTYMKLAMGVNDLTALQAAGINVALGTDGPGSNNDLDMKAVIRTTALLQKHHTRNAEALAGDLSLRMATQNGARAMGFENTGVLAVGRAADIVLFDLDKPHLYPRHNLVANLVHAARGSDVTHVIVDGRLLYRRGELLTLDEERIKAEAERHAQRMVRQNLSIVREYRG